jgi:hypothetical protein
MVQSAAGTLDMVAVKQITTGLRVRSPFEIPASPCAEQVREAAATEHGASILFDLIVRGASPIRCDVIMEILEQERAPDARTHRAGTGSSSIATSND